MAPPRLAQSQADGLRRGRDQRLANDAMSILSPSFLSSRSGRGQRFAPHRLICLTAAPSSQAHATVRRKTGRLRFRRTFATGRDAASIRPPPVAAPALGYTFGQEGLAGLDMPVQLWRVEDDEVLPHPFSAEAVRLALPKPPEMHVVAHAGHFDFLAPCSDALANVAPAICMSEPGFDRAAFHQSLDAEVVGFFQHALARGTE
jgi:predicted dienelactone hydrolase